MNFSESDIEQIKQHELTIEQIEKQIANFKSGFPYANIIRPATVNDGIFDLSAQQRKKYIDIYNSVRDTKQITKFVPASGAATRMFKDLFAFLSSGDENPTTKSVLGNITKFAFYDKLKAYINSTSTNHEIIDCIVNARGLNYGKMPKGLIPFHKYSDETRTPVQEHMVEGALYATANNISNIHFTISPEHLDDFKKLINDQISKYEHTYDIKYNITTSEQKQSTDTIAVTPDNEPFRTTDGKLLFRPAGHGALIENLNDIDSDIIFIKNIDNVSIDKSDTVEYKQTLAGMLIDIQNKIFEYLDDLENNRFNPDEICDFIKHTLHHSVSDTSRDELINILNRPIRICGVVKNIGAPGGGPFWVKNSDDTIGLQIVESAQIAPDARSIMETSTHFNPVDLVCGTRDWHGNQFDLTKYIDHSTGFISDKSDGGRPLRAMERPGLWNGAMAYWHTLFVAIPPTTFTPVKTVSDLLLPPHNNTNI